MKRLSLLRMSAGLAIVLFASSFTVGPVTMKMPATQQLQVAPPVTVTKTVNVQWNTQTATASLTYGNPGPIPYEVTVAINGTNLTNVSLGRVIHEGGAIVVDTLQAHVVDPVGGYEYDIEAKVSGVVGGQWRIDELRVVSIVI